jgi:hypothetical protein
MRKGVQIYENGNSSIKETLTYGEFTPTTELMGYESPLKEIHFITGLMMII